jgi:hypothetical protein
LCRACSPRAACRANDKIPPPEQVFDYSFILKAAEQLKAESWKPKL